MRKTLGITFAIVVSVALITGATAPVAAVDGTSDDIVAENRYKLLKRTRLLKCQMMSSQ